MFFNYPFKMEYCVNNSLQMELIFFFGNNRICLRVVYQFNQCKVNWKVNQIHQFIFCNIGIYTDEINTVEAIFGCHSFHNNIFDCKINKIHKIWHVFISFFLFLFTKNHNIFDVNGKLIILIYWSKRRWQIWFTFPRNRKRIEIVFNWSATPQ